MKKKLSKKPTIGSVSRTTATPPSEKVLITPPKAICTFCNDSFPLLTPGLITSKTELQRLSAYFIEEFQIPECDFKLQGEDAKISPFCPGCTKTVKRLDELCTQVKQLQEEIIVNRNVLVESAVNTFAYADRDAKYFRIKFDLFGKWNHVVQRNLNSDVAENNEDYESGQNEEGNDDTHEKVHMEPESPVTANSTTPDPVAESSSFGAANISVSKTLPLPTKPFVGPASMKRKYQEALAASPQLSPDPEDDHTAGVKKTCPAPAASSASYPISAEDEVPHSSTTIANTEEDRGTTKKRKKRSSGGALLSTKQKLSTLGAMMLKFTKQTTAQAPKSKEKEDEPPTISKKTKPCPASRKMSATDAPALKPKPPITVAPTPKKKKVIIVSSSEDEDEPEPPAPTTTQDPVESESDEECKHCHKVFRNKELRRKHVVASHIESDKFKCKDCGKAFFLYPKLRLHSKEAHGNILKSPVKQQRRSGQSGAGALAKSRQIRSDSMGSDRGEVVVLDFGATQGDYVEPINQNTFECKWCGLKFSHKKKLKRHIGKEHNKPNAKNSSEPSKIAPATPPESTDLDCGNWNDSNDDDNVPLAKLATPKASEKTESESNKLPHKLQISKAVVIVDRNVVKKFFQGQKTENQNESDVDLEHSVHTSGQAQEEMDTIPSAPPSPAPSSPESFQTSLPDPEQPSTSKSVLAKKVDGAWFSQSEKRPASSNLPAKSIPFKPPSLLNSKVPPNEGQIELLKKMRELEKEKEEFSTGKLPEGQSASSSDYWEDPANILLSTHLPTPRTSSFLTPPTPGSTAISRLLLLKPPLIPFTPPGIPLATARRGRVPKPPKPPISELSKKVQRFAKKIQKGLPPAAGRVGFGANSIRYEPVETEASMIGLERRPTEPRPVGVPRKKDTVSTSADGASAKTASPAEEMDDDDFDPSMFVEVGTESAKTTAVSLPQNSSSSKLPPGLKIVDLNNIIGRSSDPDAGERNPQPAASSGDDCPIRICNIRSLSAPEDDDPDIELIDLDKEPVPITNHNRIIAPQLPPSPSRRSISPKINVPTVGPIIPHIRILPAQPHGSARFREVMLPPAKPLIRKKGPRPASKQSPTQRARIATIPDTTTFKRTNMIEVDANGVPPGVNIPAATALAGFYNP